MSSRSETFPQIEANIGEDPARWLDRPLFGGSADTSAPGLMIRDRIDGIDRLNVLGCFETVERRLERGPREKVLELIEARRETLLENGQRPELPTMTREERVVLARALYESASGRKPTSDVEKPASASAKLARIRADGGRSE